MRLGETLRTEFDIDIIWVTITDTKGHQDIES